MSNIWLTSDTHFHHKNIVRGTTTWGSDPTKGDASVNHTRDFDTLEEHDEALIKNINAVVMPDDVLYHLGDWSFGGQEQVWNFRKRIYCKNIHLILGNHDHHIEKNIQLPNAHTVCKSKEEGDIIHDGPCPKVTGHDTAFIRPATSHELFKSVQDYSYREIGGQGIVMCHYAMRTWNKAHKGTWMLYGHSHGTLSNYGGIQVDHLKKGPVKTHYVNYKTMDVGIDTHPEFRPYHIEEIRKIMKDRVSLSVDHHNGETH